MNLIDWLAVLASLAVVAVPMVLAWLIVRRTGDTTTPPDDTAPHTRHRR